MAQISGGEGFEVFKFKSTGIVALCEEVTDMLRTRDDDEVRRLDLTTARFEEGDTTYSIKFDWKKDDDDRQP